MRTLNSFTSIITLLIVIGACNSKPGNKSAPEDQDCRSETDFDREKWRIKEGSTYPYRDKMLNDVVYNDSIRSLTKDEVLDLLGEPDRIREDHLYYLVAEKRLGFWPLHTKTMVIKLNVENGIEWIKVHK